MYYVFLYWVKTVKKCHYVMAWSSFANWFNLSHNALKNFLNSAKYFRNGSEMVRFLPQKNTFFRTQMILKLSGNPVILSSISLGWYPTLQSYIKLSHCLRIFTTQSQHSHHPQYQLKKQRLNSNGTSRISASTSKVFKWYWTTWSSSSWGPSWRG